MEAEIAQGKNPYADLITLSIGNDPVKAKDAVDTANGDNSVTKLVDMKFTGGIVKAGYNINMNRLITTAGPVSPASATRLTEIWTTPTDARSWVVDVVGEKFRHDL